MASLIEHLIKHYTYNTTDSLIHCPVCGDELDPLPAVELEAEKQVERDLAESLPYVVMVTSAAHGETTGNTAEASMWVDSWHGDLDAAFSRVDHLLARAETMGVGTAKVFDSIGPVDDDRYRQRMVSSEVTTSSKEGS